MTANPQKENGYTPIANELMEALAKTYLSTQEWRVLIAILRKTYGFNKKEDGIPLSQLADITGIDRRHIHRAIKKLSSRRVITVIHMGDRRVCKYRIQKDYTAWLSPIQVTKTVTHAGDKSVTHTGTLKRKKEIYTPECPDFAFKIRVAIPKNICLTERMKSYVEKQGANGNYAEDLFEDFCNHHRKTGQKWKDWTSAFYTWVRNDKNKFNPKRYIVREYID